MRLPFITAAAAILAAFFIQPSFVQAAAYQPGEPLTILTRLKSTGSAGETPSVHQWQVMPEKTSAQGSVTLSFFPRNSGVSIAQLDLSAQGIVRSARISGVSANRYKKEDLLIIPGYPAPCDILPVRRIFQQQREGPPLRFPVKRRIGGQVFADELAIRLSPVSTEEAVSQGWLKHSANDIPMDLYAVEAVNLRKDQVLSMQLWQPGADWWLYEETPSRRSWRVKAE